MITSYLACIGHKSPYLQLRTVKISFHRNDFMWRVELRNVWRSARLYALKSNSTIVKGNTSTQYTNQLENTLDFKVSHQSESYKMSKKQKGLENSIKKKTRTQVLE